MMETVKQSDEEFVRGAWEAGMVSSFARIRLGDKWLCLDSWSEAVAFTRLRLEQVRQLREEIYLLQGMIALLASEPGDLTAPVYARTITRIKAILKDKLTGMKAGA